MDYLAAFDNVIDRRGEYSLKWDVGKNELPMWVADMDFQTAPEIIEAVKRRSEHGVFGYSVIPDSWRKAIISWWQRRHHFTMEKDWLIFAKGVVPILSSVVRNLTGPGDNVLIMTPVYNMFFCSIADNKRNVLECPLVFDGTGYTIDFELLDEMLSMPRTTMMFLCNPQNPSGKIWDKGTLERIGRLCASHDVIVVSDEIHCDITDPGREYVPFASISEVCKDNCIMCIAPTKTFNIAGLHSAAAVVPNEELRRRVAHCLSIDEVSEPNAFSIIAAEAAFNCGEGWLDALREYIYSNKRTVEDYLKENIQGLELVPSEATYLLWINTQKICPDSTMLLHHIRRTTGLFLSEGRQYGRQGRSFFRMNIACPRSVLLDGLRRLEEGIKSFAP